MRRARGGPNQFRRVVFCICISNTDDHLRNHGFFVEPTGLVLSPVFDINPNPHKNHLSLAIDETDTSLNLDVASAAGAMYGLKKNRVTEVIREVVRAVAAWRREADHFGISRREQERTRDDEPSIPVYRQVMNGGEWIAGSEIRCEHVSFEALRPGVCTTAP